LTAGSAVALPVHFDHQSRFAVVSYPKFCVIKFSRG